MPQNRSSTGGRGSTLKERSRNKRGKKDQLEAGGGKKGRAMRSTGSRAAGYPACKHQYRRL